MRPIGHILITGGSGYFGNHLSACLSQSGHAVSVLDTWDNPARHRAIRFIPGNVLHVPDLERAIAGCSAVIHCAARVPLTRDSAGFWAVNYGGSVLAAATAERMGVSTFIYISSSAIYGRPTGKITDATPPAPFEDYGRTKLEGERGAATVCRRTRFVSLRPRTILGGSRLGIFSLLFSWIRTGRPVPLIGNGRHPYQLLHADDLASAVLLALRDPGMLGCYNVGANIYGTLRDDLAWLIQRADSRSRLISLPITPAIWMLGAARWLRLLPFTAWHLHGATVPFAFDCSRLLACGWHPAWSNRAMLWQSYQHFLRGSGTIGQSPHTKPLQLAARKGAEK